MSQYEAVYHCPVCNSGYDNEREAIICRNKHQPRKKEWWYCEYCGGGYSDDCGRSGKSYAESCEQAHRDKNEVEAVINRREKAEYLFRQLGPCQIPTAEMAAWVQSPEPLYAKPLYAQERMMDE